MITRFRAGCAAAAGLTALLAAGTTTAHVSAAGTVAQYVFSATPIGTAAQNGTNQTINFTVTAKDGTGAAVPGATVWLSAFNGSGPSKGTFRGCNLPLTQTYNFCVTDSTGSVTMSYTTPSTMPASGEDSVRARNGETLAETTLSRTDFFAFTNVARMAFAPSPIQPKGTMKASQTQTVVLTVLNAQGVADPNVVVWIKFVRTSTAGGSLTYGTTSVGTTLMAVTTSSAGTVTLTYKAPATLPTTGTDKVVAQNLKISPTVTTHDVYTF